MDRFHKIISLAAKIGREEEVKQVSEQMEQLLKAEDTQAVILGGGNAGKTFILNSLLGTEVKEPDMLSLEDEKPLRITFEKCEEAQEYECHVIMNPKWNDEGVVLYEFKSMYALDTDGTPAAEMNTKDIIFYVVSSLAPLTSEDVKTIKALKEAMPVHLLINKLDMVDEASREKVENYVRGFCSSHSLLQPISVEHADPETLSKTIRDLLPDVLARNQLRDSHIGAVHKIQAEKLAKALQEEIAIAKAAEDQAQSQHEEESVQRRMMRSQWKTLQTDMLEADTRTCRKAAEKLEGMTESIAERLYEKGLKHKFSEEWEQKILSQHMSEIMRKCLENMRSRIEVSLAEDVRVISRTAVERGLIDRMPMDVPNINIDVEEAVCRSYEDHGNKSFIQENQAKKILGITGAAVGLVLVVPMPLALTAAGGAAAVIAGGSQYQKSKAEWNKEEWKGRLQNYAQANVKNLIQSLEEEINGYCRSVIRLLAEQEEMVSVEVPDSGTNERVEELEEALKACAEL